MPKWIFKKQRTDHPDAKWVTWHGDKPSPPSSGPRRIRTWHVCGTCNAWMNREFEITARPFIERFMDGTATTLTPAEQALVAGWVFKTSLMWGLTGYNPDWHPPDYALRHLRRTARPPNSAFVWIGRVHDDTGPVWSRSPGSLAWWELWLPDVTVPSRSFADTFVLNRFVAHLFIPDGFPKSVGPGIDTNFNDTMIRIWPPATTTLQWPAPAGLVYKKLNALVARYKWSSRQGLGKTYRYPLRKNR